MLSQLLIPPIRFYDSLRRLNGQFSQPEDRETLQLFVLHAASDEEFWFSTVSSRTDKCCCQLQPTTALEIRTWAERTSGRFPHYYLFWNGRGSE